MDGLEEDVKDQGMPVAETCLSSVKVWSKSRELCWKSVQDSGWSERSCWRIQESMAGLEEVVVNNCKADQRIGLKRAVCDFLRWPGRSLCV